VTPLHHIGELVRSVLAGIPPGALRVLFVALPTVVLIWVLRLPRQVTTSDGGKYIDLRWIAALALLIQIAIYTII